MCFLLCSRANPGSHTVWALRSHSGPLVSDNFSASPCFSWPWECWGVPVGYLAEYIQFGIVWCFLTTGLGLQAFWKEYTEAKCLSHHILSYRVWCFILCVKLTGRRDAWKAGNTWFLGMSGRVFLKEVSIWNSRLSKADGTVQCGSASSIPLRVHIKQQGRGRAHWLFTWVGTSIFPCLRHWHSWFSIFWSQTGTHTTDPDSRAFGLKPNYTIALPSLQMADHGISWPPKPCEPIINLLTIRNISVSYFIWFCFSISLESLTHTKGDPWHQLHQRCHNFGHLIRWCLPDFPWVNLLFSPLCSLSLEASP